jgi:hypothetical protein
MAPAGVSPATMLAAASNTASSEYIEILRGLFALRRWTARSSRKELRLGRQSAWLLTRAEAAQ